MKYNFGTYIALIAGVIALSTSAIFVKLAEAPSSIIALYRLLFTALTLSPFLLFNKKNRAELQSLKGSQYIRIVLSGFLLAVHYVMWFESLRFTSVASSTVLVSLQPLFSLFYGLIFLKEGLTKNAVIGCLIAICGSAIIGWGDFQISGIALVGDILAFLAAGVISMYFLIGQVVRKQISAVTYSVLSYLNSVVFLLIYALIKQDPLTGYGLGTWGAFLGLAFVSTIGGQFVFNLLLKNVSASAVTMSILGEPIGTCILAYFILGESIAPRQLVGIIVIMTGLSIYFFYPILKDKRH